MQKCVQLFGSFVKRNDAYINALNTDINEATCKFKSRMLELHNRSVSTPKKRARVRSLIASEMERLDKKMSKLQDRIAYWEESPDSFTFILEELA